MSAQLSTEKFLSNAYDLAQLSRFAPERSTAADVRRAADLLPLTIDSLQALISIAEQFAYSLYKETSCTNVDVVHDFLVSAFESMDDVGVKE